MEINLQVDAVPYGSWPSDSANPTSFCLDLIKDKLTITDYKSMFFLLMDSIISPIDFLTIIKKDKESLHQEFLRIYHGFHSKEALLIELFGTMKRFDLLKILRTCKHVFLDKDGEKFNQIDQLWKCLYAVCECLTDREVFYLKQRLLPDIRISISLTEELLCQALCEKKFQRNNLKILSEVFKDINSECFQLISTYQGSQKLNYYHVRRPTRHSPCGLAVIFNHVDFVPTESDQVPFLSSRPESTLDAESLKALWDSFGFETSIHTNCSKRTVMNIFNSISRRDHSSFDVFIACYLSHGDEGLVYASDSQPINLIDLMDIMANNCTSLVNKPKLFFVQACQGKQVQQGVGNATCTLPTRSAVTDPLCSKSLMSTPLYSDILIMTSSFPGTVSYRPIAENSWFIGALVEKMGEFGEDLTVSNILTKVVDCVAAKIGSFSCLTNCKQIPVSFNTLKKELRFKKLS